MDVKNESNEMKLVWAKMKYFSYWPARVVDTPPCMGRTPANKTCVLFFGSKQFGFVDLDKILDYQENRERFVKKGRGNGFNDAVNRMEEFISNPTKFKSNAFAKPIGNKVAIKTERGMQQQLGIKQEVAVGDDNHQNHSSNRANVSKLAVTPKQDNKKLLEAFTSLKTENQKITFDLKKKSEEYSKLLSHVDVMKKELVATKTMVTELQTKIAEYEQKNSQLAHENRVLSARTKQIQTGITKQEENTKNDNGKEKTDIYEVEKLIDDKKMGKIRYFLVRWKGYGPSDDTWERESNLKCAAILKKYLQTKQK